MRSVTIATAAGLAAGLGAGLGVVDGTAHGQGLRPDCYFWDPPSNPAQVLPANFSPLVRPLLYGVLTQDQILDGVNPSRDGVKELMSYYMNANGERGGAPSWIAPGHVSVLLQNVMTDGQFTHPPSQILISADGVDVDVDEDPLNAPDSPLTTCGTTFEQQPWLKNGLSSATAWWDLFGARYATKTLSSGAALPPIDRLHLDIEGNGTTEPFGQASAFLLYAMPLENEVYTTCSPPITLGFPTSENRWNTLAVPGFGGQTLATLWGQVSGPHFGGRATPFVTSGPLQNYNPLVPDAFHTWNTPAWRNLNRTLYLWWAGVSSRAVTAVQTQAAMDTLKARWPAMKGSNYGDVTLTPGLADFGWHRDSYRAGSVGADKWIRVAERGTPDALGWGWDLPYTDQAWGKRYIMADDSRATGDFSGPSLYAVGFSEDIERCSANQQWSWRFWRQKSVYLPLQPIDNRWTASLRWHRRQLESIVASVGELSGGEPWRTLAPWVPAVGINANYIGSVCCTPAPGSGLTGAPCSTVPGNVTVNDSFVLSATDANLQLNLVKAKGVGEMLVFNPGHALPGSTGYDAWTKAYDQVYDPIATSVDADPSVCVVTSPEPMGQTGAWLTRIGDTNPRWAGPGVGTPHEFTVQSLSSPFGQKPRTWVQWRTRVTPGVGGPILPIAADETLRVTLEGEIQATRGRGSWAARPAPGQLRSDLVLAARVFAFDFASGAWSPLSVGDEDLAGWPSPDSTRLRFFAPEEGATLGEVRQLMRRTLDLCVDPAKLARLIDPATGEVLLAVEHSAVANALPADTQLSSRWDLLQVTRAPRADCAVAPRTSDALTTLAVVLPSCDSLDFNGDGIFPDNQDLIDFLEVFAGGECPSPSCGDLDFNNDGIFPDNADIAAFLDVLSGGLC
jgi:hypothetical protein